LSSPGGTVLALLKKQDVMGVIHDVLEFLRYAAKTQRIPSQLKEEK
jgi:hypothetical protein